MNNYYVTETLGEAQAHEASDFIEFKVASPSPHAKYWETTDEWCTPSQRLDGKWIRAVCPNSTATGRTIEAYDASWFPEETRQGRVPGINPTRTRGGSITEKVLQSKPKPQLRKI